MNLNNLKPAWRQFLLLNSMQSMDKEEILFIIEQAEDIAIGKSHGFLINSVLLMVLIVCCQGG